MLVVVFYKQKLKVARAKYENFIIYREFEKKRKFLNAYREKIVKKTQIGKEEKRIDFFKKINRKIK